MGNQTFFLLYWLMLAGCGRTDRGRMCPSGISKIVKKFTKPAQGINRSTEHRGMTEDQSNQDRYDHCIRNVWQAADAAEHAARAAANSVHTIDTTKPDSIRDAVRLKNDAVKKVWHNASVVERASKDFAKDCTSNVIEKVQNIAASAVSIRHYIQANIDKFGKGYAKAYLLAKKANEKAEKAMHVARAIVNKTNAYSTIYHAQGSTHDPGQASHIADQQNNNYIPPNLQEMRNEAIVAHDAAKKAKNAYMEVVAYLKEVTKDINVIVQYYTSNDQVSGRLADNRYGPKDRFNEYCDYCLKQIQADMSPFNQFLQETERSAQAYGKVYEQYCILATYLNQAIKADNQPI